MLPLLLVGGLVWDQFRSDRLIPSFLSLVPTDVDHFAAVERLDNLVQEAGNNRDLMVSLLRQANVASGWADFIGGVCNVWPKADALAEAGLDGSRPAAGLFLRSGETGLVLPLVDRTRLQEFLTTSFATTLSVSTDSNERVRILGRAEAGTQFCNQATGAIFTVASDGVVNIDAAVSRASYLVSGTPADGPLELRCEAAGEGNACACAIRDRDCSTGFGQAPSEHTEDVLPGQLWKTVPVAGAGWICLGEAAPNLAVLFLVGEEEPAGSEQTGNLCRSEWLDGISQAVRAPENRDRFSQDGTVLAALKAFEWGTEPDRAMAVLPMSSHPGFGPLVLGGQLQRGQIAATVLAAIQPGHGRLIDRLMLPADDLSPRATDLGAFGEVELADPALPDYLRYARALVDPSELRPYRSAILDILQGSSATAFGTRIRADIYGVPADMYWLEFGEGAAAETAANKFLPDLSGAMYRARFTEIGDTQGLQESLDADLSELPCDADDAAVEQVLAGYRERLSDFAPSFTTDCYVVLTVEPAEGATVVPASEDPDDSDDVDVYFQLEQRLRDVLDTVEAEKGCGTTLADLLERVDDVTKQELEALAPKVTVECRPDNRSTAMKSHVDGGGKPEPFSIAGVEQQLFYISPPMRQADVDSLVKAAKAIESQPGSYRPIDSEGLLKGEYRWVGWRQGTRVYVASRSALAQASLASPEMREASDEKLRFLADGATMEQEYASYPPDLQSLVDPVMRDALASYRLITVDAKPVGSLSSLQANAVLEAR